MFKFIKKNWLILLVLLVASALRLYRIGDYMEFLGDQGRDVVIISKFLKHGDLFFIGPQTSIGNMYLGPYFYYLIAPALLFANFSPVGPAVFIALLGVATVYLIYLIGKKWFTPNVGYIAAFLYAIAPVTIKYSNFIWNPNIMPLFALLFVYFMAETKYIWAVLSFIMALNSHYLALLLLPTGAIIWLYNFFATPSRRPEFLKNTFFAALIFIISLTPQVLFDLKHNGQNANAILSFFTKRETTVNLKVYKSIPVIPELFNQINTSLLAGRQNEFGLPITIIFTIGILAYLFYTYQKKQVSKFTIFLILWLAVGVVGLGLYKQHIYDHYFGFLFPVVFLLIALVIKFLGKVFGSLLFIFIASVLIFNTPFRWQPPHQLATTQKIVDSIVADAGNQPFNFTLLAKTNYDPGYRYLLDQQHAPVYLIQDKITEKLYVVCEPHPDINCQPLNNPEWGVAAFGWAKIDKTWQVDNIQIFSLSHDQSSN